MLTSVATLDVVAFADPAKAAYCACQLAALNCTPAAEKSVCARYSIVVAAIAVSDSIAPIAGSRLPLN